MEVAFIINIIKQTYRDKKRLITAVWQNADWLTLTVARGMNFSSKILQVAKRYVQGYKPNIMKIKIVNKEFLMLSGVIPYLTN